MEARISTSGHILEWLAFYLPDSELKADWVQQAANAVSLKLTPLARRNPRGECS